MIEQLEVLRRIAERGLKLAQKRLEMDHVDIWQHMLDEIERTKWRYLTDV